MENDGERLKQKGDISPEQKIELDKAIDKILDERKEKRVGARVFCVSCGAGKRVPLRRWHNSYICFECWKLKNIIGEMEFINRLKGESS